MVQWFSGIVQAVKGNVFTSGSIVILNRTQHTKYHQSIIHIISVMWVQFSLVFRFGKGDYTALYNYSDLIGKLPLMSLLLSHFEKGCVYKREVFGWVM